MKKLFILCALCLWLQLPVSAQEFPDVDESHWFYPYVSSMVAEGLVGGYDSGYYCPDQTLTLAEFSVMLANAFYGTSLELVNQADFQTWWEPYIYACNLRGGLTETTVGLQVQEYFEQGYLFNRWDAYAIQPLTRYDMVTMVYNVLRDRYVPSATLVQAETILQNFSDIDSSSPYAIALATAYQEGLVSGRNNGTFDGESTLNRAEATVVLYTLVSSVKIDLETYANAVDTLNSPEYNGSSYYYTGHLDIENYVLARVNELRASLGLNTLTSNNTLVTYAYTRSQETEVYWSHTRPDGRSWSTVIPMSDTVNQLTGENLTMASGFSYYEFGDMIFKSWLNSPEHYANMISPRHEEVGTAVYVTEAGAYYATQIFGKPVNT